MIAARPSPLILVHKFVPKMRLEATPNFKSESEVSYRDMPITVRQGIQWLEEHGCWGVEVVAECWPPEDVALPYRFEIEAFGAFRVQPGIVPDEEHQIFVAANASAILYGWIREVVRANTAFGPFGPIELPLVFFPRTSPASQPAVDAPSRPSQESASASALEACEG